MRARERRAERRSRTRRSSPATSARWSRSCSSAPGAPDVVVVDPPRAGLAGKALRRLGRLGPPRLVYVSCNPTTLAGDVKTLREEYGYELLRVTPVDMFPHTPHVEAVALLERAVDGRDLVATLVATRSQLIGCARQSGHGGHMSNAMPPVAARNEKISAAEIQTTRTSGRRRRSDEAVPPLGAGPGVAARLRGARARLPDGADGLRLGAPAGSRCRRRPARGDRVLPGAVHDRRVRRQQRARAKPRKKPTTATPTTAGRR